MLSLNNNLKCAFQTGYLKLKISQSQCYNNAQKGLRFEKVYFALLSLSLEPWGCIYDSKTHKSQLPCELLIRLYMYLAHLMYHSLIPRKGIYVKSVKLLLVLSIYCHV